MAPVVGSVKGFGTVYGLQTFLLYAMDVVNCNVCMFRFDSVTLNLDTNCSDEALTV